MNIPIRKPIVQFAMFFALTLGAHGADDGGKKIELLSRHETVAEFRGTRQHKCMGLTSLCPDECGHSGSLATFKIIKYLKYEKPGEYGDPKSEEFVFLVEDNKKKPKVSAKMRAAVNTLKQGDMVLLSWNHNYVTVNGSSSPERPLARLEKIGDPGSQVWLRQIEDRVGVRDGAGHGPDLGSDEWMKAVSAKLGVIDSDGHGPTLGGDEWRNAVHWKAFGIKPKP